MSALRYAFASVMIIIGIISVLGLGGFPSQGEDPFETFLFAVLIYAGGLALFTWGFGRFRKLQLVRNTPTSKIRSMAMGNVEIKGEAKDKQKIFEAPFSKEECIYCKYKVEEYYEDDDGGDWRTKLSDENRTEFGIEDGTGEAIIRPEGADFRLPADNTYTVRDHEEPPEKIKEFLRNNEEVDLQEGGWFSVERDRRYKEWYITPGEELYIYGYSDTDKEGNPIIKEGKAPMFMVSDKSEEEIRDNWSTTYKLMIAAGIPVALFGYFLMASTTTLI
jgi:hypothetical protein